MALPRSVIKGNGAWSSLGLRWCEFRAAAASLESLVCFIPNRYLHFDWPTYQHSFTVKFDKYSDDQVQPGGMAYDSRRGL